MNRPYTAPPVPRRRALALLLPLLTALNLAAILLLAGVERWVAERHWLALFLTYLPQQPYVLPSGLLVLASLPRRGRRCLPWNAFAAVLCGWLVLGFQVPTPRPCPPGTPLRVMTYNLHQGVVPRQVVTALLRYYRPDVLCLQEARGLDRASPGYYVEGESCGLWAVHRVGELAVLTRHPVEAERVHHVHGAFRGLILELRLRVQGRPLTLFDVHLTTAFTPDMVRHNLRALPLLLDTTLRSRRSEVAALLAATDLAHGPLIVAGDFNTPPKGLLYRGLRSRLRNTFEQVSWGFGYTFRSDFPLVRIDHIWLGRGVAPRDCFVPHLPLSDHRPMIADLVLTDDGR